MINHLYKRDPKDLLQSEWFRGIFQGRLIKSVLKNTTEVAEKKLKWSGTRGNELKFVNEIINFQILEEAKNSKFEDMCPYIAEYMGFILYTDVNDEFFGSILTKWYPLGDFSIYREKRMQSNEQIKNFELVDLAGQIAKGKNMIYFLLSLLINLLS